MKIEIKIERGVHSNQAICKLISSKDPDVFYEFSSYTNAACDAVEKLMEEDKEDE